MSEFTPIGQGTQNTVAGSIGLASAVLGNGGLGGLFGNNRNSYGYDYGYNHGVSRDAFDVSMRLAAAESTNALLAAELKDETKIVETYNALYRNERDLEQRMEKGFAEQAVINCSQNNRLSLLEATVKQLMGMTKLGILPENIWPAATP